MPWTSSASPGGSSRSLEGSDGDSGKWRSTGSKEAQKYGEMIKKARAMHGMGVVRLQECRREVQLLSEKNRTELISQGSGRLSLRQEGDLREAMNQVISLIETRSKQVQMIYPPPYPFLSSSLPFPRPSPSQPPPGTCPLEW